MKTIPVHKLYLMEPGFTGGTNLIVRDLLPFITKPLKSVLYISQVKIQKAILEDAIFDHLQNDVAVRMPISVTINDLFMVTNKNLIGDEERVILLMFLVQRNAGNFPHLIPKSGRISIPFAQQILRLFDNLRLYMKSEELSDVKRECQNFLGTYPGVLERALDAIHLFEFYNDFLTKNGLMDTTGAFYQFLKSPISSFDGVDVVVIDGLTYLTPLHSLNIKKFLEKHLGNGGTFIGAVYDVPEIEGLHTAKSVLAETLRKTNKFETVYCENECNPEIKVYAMTNTSDEVNWVAREIKNMAINAHDVFPKVLITSPSVYNYLPYIGRAFNEYGITVGRQFGPPITLHPFIKFLMNLFDIILEDFPRRETVNLFLSPFYRMEKPDKFEIDKASLNFSIMGTRKQWEDFISNGKNSSLTFYQRQRLAEFFKFTKKLEDTKDFISHLEAVKKFILDFADTTIITEPKVHEELLTSINTLEQIGEVLGNPEISLRSFRDIFYSILRQKRLPEPEIPPPQHPVQFVGFEQVMHIPHDFLFIMGLDETSYPQELADWRIFPDRLRKSLGLPHRDQLFDLQEVRFKAITKSPRHNCFITYPSITGTYRKMPSIFVDTKFESRSDYSKWRVENVFSKKEKLRIQGLSTGIPFRKYKKEGIEKLLDIISKNLHESGEPISVTDLEDYVKCPKRFLIEKICKLESIDEPVPILAPLVEGNWFHKVMETAFIELKKNGFEQNFYPNFHEIAKKISDKLNLYPLWHYYLVNRYQHPFEMVINAFKEYSDLVVDVETEYWLELEILPGYPLRGIVDRIDLLENGSFIIVDYKTSNLDSQFTKSVKNAKEGKLLQLPLYAHMYRLKTGRFPLKMMFAAWYENSFKLIDIPRQWKKNPDTIYRVINAAVGKTKEIVDNIRRGEFPTNPKRCWECAFTEICPLQLE